MSVLPTPGADTGTAGGIRTATRSPPAKIPTEVDARHRGRTSRHDHRLEVGPPRTHESGAPGRARCTTPRRCEPDARSATARNCRRSASAREQNVGEPPQPVGADREPDHALSRRADPRRASRLVGPRGTAPSRSAWSLVARGHLIAGELDRLPLPLALLLHRVDGEAELDHAVALVLRDREPCGADGDQGFETATRVLVKRQMARNRWCMPSDAPVAKLHAVRRSTLVRLLGVGERGIKTDQRDAQQLSKASWQTDVPSVHIPDGRPTRLYIASNVEDSPRRIHPPSA